jgi:hypothetical protein
VPNARLGSITSGTASVAGVSHGGANRPVELAPALLPAPFDVDGVEAGRRVAFDVRGKLELSGVDDLLESLREALDPLGPRLLGALERHAHGDAFQRKTLFSLSKKLSSFL